MPHYATACSSQRTSKGSRGPISTVRIVVEGVGPSIAELHAGLVALRPPCVVDWQLLTKDTVLPNQRIDIAVIDWASAGRAALERWPNADIVALLPASDHGAEAVVALNAGATVCVQGPSVDLLAAYIHAVARRRGLLT